MARQKKCYCSTDAKTNRHQSRGGGVTKRLNNPHRYPTQPLVTPISPTFIKATEAKKLKV